MRSSRAQMVSACVAILVLVTGAAIGTQAQGPSRKPMTLVDLAELPRIAGASPQISPDGRTLAYLLTRTDWKAGRLIFQLWRQEIGGGAPVQLTFGDRGVQPGGQQAGAQGWTSVRWSPDGKAILFMRDGQCWLLAADGGEPRA